MHAGILKQWRGHLLWLPVVFSFYHVFALPLPGLNWPSLFPPWGSDPPFPKMAALFTGPRTLPYQDLEQVHIVFSPFGVESIRDWVQSGLSLFGVQSIRDWVHLELGPLGVQSIRCWIHLDNSPILGSVGESLPLELSSINLWSWKFHANWNAYPLFLFPIRVQFLFSMMHCYP